MNTEKTNDSPFAALWKFFASVKSTITVLLLLAITSVIGTLIPQNAAPAAYINSYGEFAYRMLHVFDLFDMYYSWWFRTLIGLLTANIIVCTIRRWPAIWKIVTTGRPQIRPTGSKHPLCEFSDPRKPQELERIYQDHVRRRYRFHRIESGKEGFRIMAEKGRWSRLGVPAVHLSVVLVLAGALVGSLLGFDGFVNIPEGGSADHIKLRNSNATLPLGFEIRCDDFNVSYYESGAPKEYRSRLAVLENGRKVIEKDIIVNDPLRYKGIDFFQSSYGSMPPKNLEMSFTFKDSGKAFRSKVSIGQTVELPQNAGRFTVLEYRRDYHYKGAEMGAAVIGGLEKPGKEPTEVALPLRFPSFDKMRRGEWIIAVEGHDNRFYTGLQVTRDPGVPLVYAGFILMLIGCWMAFFMSHKKIVVDVTPRPHSSCIKVFGSTNRNRIGFEQQVCKLAGTLSRL